MKNKSKFGLGCLSIIVIMVAIMAMSDSENPDKQASSVTVPQATDKISSVATAAPTAIPSLVPSLIPTPAATPTPTLSPTKAATVTPKTTSSPATFPGGDKDCSDFTSQSAAQAYFNTKGGSPSNNVDDLDRDHDGIACESLN